MQTKKFSIFKYSVLDIEQLGMCIVKSRLKEKRVIFRLFVVPDGGPTLHGMPGIKLLSILKITCDIID